MTGFWGFVAIGVLGSIIAIVHDRWVLRRSNSRK